MIQDFSHPVYPKQWCNLPFLLCPISPAYTAARRLLLAKGNKRYNVMRNLKECSSEQIGRRSWKKLRQVKLTFRYESSIVGSYFSTKIPCTNWTVWIRKQEINKDEKTMRSKRMLQFKILLRSSFSDRQKSIYKIIFRFTNF